MDEIKIAIPADIGGGTLHDKLIAVLMFNQFGEPNNISRNHGTKCPVYTKKQSVLRCTCWQYDRAHQQAHAVLHILGTVVDHD